MTPVDPRSVPAVTADRMREVDRLNIAEIDTKLVEMLKNAGGD